MNPFVPKSGKDNSFQSAQFTLERAVRNIGKYKETVCEHLMLDIKRFIVLTHLDGF